MAAAPTALRPQDCSPRLYNEDLAPLPKRSWGTYQVFCMWMSDVHSVGGYLFAASLFALGLAGWQVLVCLLVGIVIVMFATNLVARPGVDLGVPYPVVCRLAFGVFGANIPAIIRAMIAVAWYGIQTFVASKALVVVMLKFFPGLIGLERMSFLGLSCLGWIAFLIMWGVQFLVFRRGMKAITHFIDWAGPGVYAVMFLLAIWLVYKAGWRNVSFTLADVKYSGWGAFWQMVVATALVVSYFSGPMVNFSDFSRFAKSMGDVRRGNFWGLPVNFLAFSIVTVVTVSATRPVFGLLINDPVEIVSRIDNTAAVLLGAGTFLIATIGINIVANFVSPAYDLANVSPRHITFIRGGMIAAVLAVFVMPWHLFNSPAVIHYTLDTLGAAIGPLYGILVADYYLVRHEHLFPRDLFSERKDGQYWYRGGINPVAVAALAVGIAFALLFVLIPSLSVLAPFTWFIGVLAGGGAYWTMMSTSGAGAARAAQGRQSQALADGSTAMWSAD